MAETGGTEDACSVAAATDRHRCQELHSGDSDHRQGTSSGQERGDDVLPRIVQLACPDRTLSKVVHLSGLHPVRTAGIDKNQGTYTGGK